MNRRQCLALLAGTAAATVAPSFCLGQNEGHMLRVAVSTDTLAGANINDARAAYKVWIQEVSRHLGAVQAEVVPEIFIPSEQLIRMIRQGGLDCYGITALEYAKVMDLTDPGTLLLQDYLVNGMEYILLVHNSSPFKKLADLRGAQIVSHHHRDMVLLPAWLGTLLAENNLPSTERFFGSQVFRDNLNQVVLPVFFHRMDGACLARRHWDTAVELNPQLGRDLRVLAVSPKIVPIAVCFRRNCSVEGRRSFTDAVLHITAVPAGQQIVALYQSNGFVVQPSFVMKTAVDMVRQYERVLARLPANLRKGQL
jgi:ABC-type phosphate/phosphonate transport system substrate-binding protein